MNTHVEEKAQLASNKPLVRTLNTDKLTISFVKNFILFFNRGQDWVNSRFMVKKDKKKKRKSLPRLSTMCK